MSARRLAFAGLSLGALIAALYTGDRLYALILAFMLALLLIALLHALYTLTHFRYIQLLAKQEAVKGEDVQIKISLYNEGLIPYGRVRATYWLPDNLTGAPLHLLEGDIPAYGELAFERAFPCTYRGEFQPGLRSVKVSDLFGLISLSVPYANIAYRPMRLTVRPRVLSLRDEAQLAMVRQGRMDAADVSAQEASSVRDIRAFREGDPLKWVHFKLSARRRTALVREFEGSARPNTLLILDAMAHGRQGAEALEIEDALVEAAAALSHHLLEERAPVRLVGYGTRRFEAAGSEPRDFAPMYAYYTLAKFDGRYPLADVLSLEARDKGQHVLAVSSRIDAKLYGALLALREAGNDVAVVLVATAAERAEGAERYAVELRRNGVRCGLMSPGEELHALRGVL